MKTRSNAGGGAQVNTFLLSTESFRPVPIDDYTITNILTTVFADRSKIKEKIRKRKLLPTFCYVSCQAEMQHEINYTAQILTLQFNRIEQCIYIC